MDKQNESRLSAEKEKIAQDPERRLALKQRMMILSRRDRMGHAAPTLLRMLIVTVLIFAVVIVGAKLQTNAWNAQTVAGTPVRENEVQLSFTGDVMMGRYVSAFAQTESYSALFKDAKELWKDSSFVFTNLESPVTYKNSTYTEADKICFSTSKASIKALARAGINAVSAANDHMADYGRKSVRHTLETLDANGITYAGAGANLEDAGNYRLMEADGMTVGFMACTMILPEHFAATKDGYGVCPDGYSNLYRNILEASSYSDLLVVYVHWGADDSLKVTERQRDFAHQLIESGADVVIGSNPHVLQEIEQYQNGIVFYSLGNFVFDQGARTNRNSVMVQLNVDTTSGNGYFTLIPMRINNFHPYVTTNSFYVSQIQRNLLKALPEGSYSIGEDGRVTINMSLYEPGQKQTPPEKEPADTDTTDAPGSND